MEKGEGEERKVLPKNIGGIKLWLNPAGFKLGFLV